MRSIAFEIPGKVQAWQRTGTGLHGHFTKPETRAYENLVKLGAQEAMAGEPPMEGPVRVLIQVWIGIPNSWSARKKTAAMGVLCIAKPDADNCAKSVLDGLKGVAYRDDVQVSSLNVQKRYGARPRADITVSADEDMF